MILQELNVDDLSSKTATPEAADEFYNKLRRNGIGPSMMTAEGRLEDWSKLAANLQKVTKPENQELFKQLLTFIGLVKKGEFADAVNTKSSSQDYWDSTQFGRKQEKIGLFGKNGPYPYKLKESYSDYLQKLL